MKCDNCTEKCPQGELACEMAKGRMYATNEVIRLQKELEAYQEIGMSLEVVEEFKRMDKENDGELTVMMKSIRELGQYRRLGTVEELKSMKRNGAFSGVELARIYAMQSKLKKYESIGTVEEFKDLKKKKAYYEKSGWERVPCTNDK